MARLLLALLLPIACGQPAAPPDAPAPAAVPAGAAAAFSGTGHAGPAELVPFPADQSRESLEANRRANEAALLRDELVLHRCTAGRALCARLVEEGGRWHLDFVERAGGAERRIRYTPSRQPDGESEASDFWYHLWPSLIRERGGGVLVGLADGRRQGGSGGAMLTDRLSLIRFAPGTAAAAEVLRLPLAGTATWRACYGEQDMRLRREACTDDFEFGGTLSLAPGAAAAGPPPLLFTTRARTFPGRAFRLTDAEAAARERRQFARADLAWAGDEQCSYRRTFSFDAAAGRYGPDSPLPDCGDYLVGDD